VDAGAVGNGRDGAPGAFIHPGALNDGAQLDYIRGQITAGVQPWSAAVSLAQAFPNASLTFTTSPPTDTNGDVGCGAGSNPDIHCHDERNAAGGAYTDALIWRLTGNTAYATKAIEIMNAWSSSMKSHSLSNAVLQSGWVGTLWGRAGEIMRDSNSGWSQADITQFASMLTNAYVPYVKNGAPTENGNWELSCADALIQMAVFLDDRTLFDQAVALWKRRVPAYIYMKTDGPTPVTFPGEGGNWNGATTYFDGLSQETCRDLGHTQFAFAAMINVAETARIQGVDLYSLEAPRITTALELHAGYINSKATSCAACSLTVSTAGMWEIAYNEYAGRLGMALPNTDKLVTSIRPTGGDNYFIDWETLTHADIKMVGIQ
jgi:hypothetical protein